MYVDFCHFCCFVTELKKYLICLEISPLPYLWLTKVFSVIIRMLFISDFFTLMNIMYMCVCAFVLQAYVCMWCVCLCVHVCVCVCVCVLMHRWEYSTVLCIYISFVTCAFGCQFKKLSRTMSRSSRSHKMSNSKFCLFN